MKTYNEAIRQQATSIGRKQGLLASVIGAVSAYLIMTWFMSQEQGYAMAFLWFVFVDYKLNLLVGAMVLLVSGYLFGGLAGKWILINKRKPILSGFVAGMGTLISTAFLSGWLGFFREGLSKQECGFAFTDYVGKPLYWITLFGTIPALLVGSWLGWRIKKKEATLKY